MSTQCILLLESELELQKELDFVIGQKKLMRDADSRESYMVVLQWEIAIRKQLQQVWKLRRVLSGLAADGNAAPGLELLIDRLKTFRTNDEFLSEIARQPSM